MSGFFRVCTLIKKECKIFSHKITCGDRGRGQGTGKNQNHEITRVGTGIKSKSRNHDVGDRYKKTFPRGRGQVSGCWGQL